MHITMTASILGSSMRGRHMCMHTGRVHRVHTPRRCMPVLCAIADPTRRPPPVSTLKDPAHIGARTTKNATVAVRHAGGVLGTCSTYILSTHPYIKSTSSGGYTAHA